MSAYVRICPLQIVAGTVRSQDHEQEHMVPHHRRPITTTVLDVDLVALVAAAGCCWRLLPCAVRVLLLLLGCHSRLPPPTTHDPFDLFDTFTLRPLVPSTTPVYFPLACVRSPASPRLPPTATVLGCLAGWLYACICLHMIAYDCIYMTAYDCIYVTDCMARAGLFFLEHNLVFSSILRPLPRPSPNYLRTYAPARTYTYTYTHARVPPKKQSCPRSIRRPLNRLAASLRTANHRCPCPRASSLGRSSAFVQPRLPNSSPV